MKLLTRPWWIMGRRDSKLISVWWAMRMFCFNMKPLTGRGDQCDNFEMILDHQFPILKPYWMEIYICPLWPLVDPCCWLDTDTWLNTTEEDIQAENGIFSTIYLGNYTMTGNKKFLRRYTCKIIKLYTARAHLCHTGGACFHQDLRDCERSARSDQSDTSPGLVTQSRPT